MDETLDRAWRDERARIVRSLARRFGDLDLAEDAVQEAFVAASARWPTDGTPENAGAWLQTTAYRRAIGMIRRHRPTVDLDHADAAPATADRADADEPIAVTDDDLFALVLTCCHPALAVETRIALTLRHVCGLSSGQIAAAFVVSEPTMSKRLVRARHKIQAARISFDPPSAAALADRVDDVRTVLYLVFTEGYLASGDRSPVRPELCDEAIWLGRHLWQLRPDDESTGLLALMLLQHARRDARQDDEGQLVALPDQNRAHWDNSAIAEARTLLGSTTGTRLGRFQVEAAIALLHVTGATPDWSRIADLYGVLGRIHPSPIVEINRALAVGYADGGPAGLAIIDGVLDSGRLADYAPLHAVHAELLEAVDDPEAAREAWTQAAETTDNPARRRAAQRRAAALTTTS